MRFREKLGSLRMAKRFVKLEGGGILALRSYYFIVKILFSSSLLTARYFPCFLRIRNSSFFIQTTLQRMYCTSLKTYYYNCLIPEYSSPGVLDERDH